MNPKILFYDIETTDLDADFGNMVAFGYKVLGSPRATVLSLLDFAPVCGECARVDAVDDKALVKAAAAVLSQADMWVTWYGKGFDAKYTNTRMVDAGMPPLPPIPHVDLYWCAKTHLKLSSNRLASVQDFLRLKTHKTPVSKRMWRRAQAGHVPSIKYIITHCTTPEARALTADLRWVPTGDLRPGDELVGFDEKCGPYGRYYRRSVVLANTLEPADVLAVELSSGEVFYTTAEHQWLTGALCHRGGDWVESQRLRPHCSSPKYASKLVRVIPTFEPAQDYQSGWLAGMLDGEGSMGQHHSVNISQRPGPVLEQLRSWLSARGTQFSQRLVATVNSAGLGKRDCQVLHIRGPLPDRLALLGTLRPTRLLQKIDPDLFGRLERRNREQVTVRRVTPAGTREVAKVTTSTATLIIEGYPTHNCAADVNVLEEAYAKLRPFVRQHPRVNGEGCRVCGSMRLERRGTAVTLARGPQVRLHCRGCGHWEQRALRKGEVA